MITFEEIREKALLEQIPDNKVSIGIWAKIKGYRKVKREIHNNKFVWLYSND